MSRSFRYLAPEPRADLLPRPRLLRALNGRWQRRVVTLVGGPGLGKTTLLAQTLAENRLAPQGDDAWVTLERADRDAGRLAPVVATALGVDSAADGGGGAPPAPGDVAQAIWQRAPTEACLVLDDVHLVPRGSTGAAWLADLVAALPGNGHLVLASRAEPPLPLDRYRGERGDGVLELAEDDLRFSPDELVGFADRRGVDPGLFGPTGGWPAMAELIASAGPAFTGAYLWEQVLEPLGPGRRAVLAAVCELRGADDDLASAVLGRAVGLDRELAGVPLVSRRPDGWYTPHDLWCTTPALALPTGERRRLRRRAADHLVGRRWFEEAFALLQDDQQWDAVPAVLRAACLSNDRVPAVHLARWIAACPAEVRSTTAGRLAMGFRAAMSAPGQATEPLLTAIESCRGEGDTEAELAAIAQLAMVAWSRQDSGLLADLDARVVELDADGHRVAQQLLVLRSAFLADHVGDDEQVLAHLADLDLGHLPPISVALAAALEAAIHYTQGRGETARDIVHRALPQVDPTLRWFVEGIALMARQGLGEIDRVVERLPSLTDECLAVESTPIVHPALCITTVMYAQYGRTTEARRCLGELRRLVHPKVGASLPVLTMLATIAVQVAEGNEGLARSTLAATIAERRIDHGMLRRWWRHSLATTYVLAPEARRHWDAAPLTGDHDTARRLGRLLVELRAAGPGDHLRTAVLPDVAVVRSLLHHRHAAELAAGLAAVGRPEGPALLELLGPPGRDALRGLADRATPGRTGRAARSLLAAAPAPPPRPTSLLVLGHIAVRRDGAMPPPDQADDDTAEGDLRRQRVRELLAFLVTQRRTTRAHAMEVLWPGMDERAAGNNLAVTLNWLLRLLEPWRGAGEAPFLVRVEGSGMRLVTGEHLRLDVDEFEAGRLAANRAEQAGAPEEALDHLLKAVELYRGDLCADVDREWLLAPREHYRSRFVDSAVRAAQLLLARHDADRAEAVAHRALAVDHWAEDAYAVLIGVALHRRDRSAAHRLVGLCLGALADLGVGPSETTLRLQRRLTTA